MPVVSPEQYRPDESNYMRLYVAIQNDQPIDILANNDFSVVCKKAQEWADYSKRPVHVLEVAPGLNNLKVIILPNKG